MKAVFDDEVARSLGYQKYWPEKSDWILAIAGTILLGLVIAGIAYGILKYTGIADRDARRYTETKALFSEWCASHTIEQMTLDEARTCKVE